MIAVCAISAQDASAQPFVLDASATYTLVASEVDRSTGLPSSASPGFIDPSESVRLTLQVSFAPGVGSTINYFSPPGTGVVLGWGSTRLDLKGTGGTVGTFSPVVAAPLFTPIQGFANPDELLGFGARANPYYLGQTSPINTSNPIDSLATLVWTPASYTPRTVSFNTHRLEAVTGVTNGIGLLVAPGQSDIVRMLGPITFAGTGPIVIVPAPATLPLLLAGLAFRRPRRGRATTPRRLA
ncbi:MAG: hypothetical protein JNM80_00710 [Phycisphaerae bacterium]|nr:hypothetical protein [Phycisphaerae bacterium]